MALWNKSSPCLQPLVPAPVPMYLAAWFFAFGYSITVIKTANITLSIITLAAIYLCTRGLYDHRKALALTAIMAMQPVLIIMTSHSFSENIVVLTYITAVWAILKGFKEPKYLLLGGFLAGLSYLSRPNVGYLFILIGAVGLAWRFYYDRWGLFRNRYYMGAIALFSIIFGSWTLQNISHFGLGGWETNPLITEMMISALRHPDVSVYGFYTQSLATMKLRISYSNVCDPSRYTAPPLPLTSTLSDHRS